MPELAEVEFLRKRWNAGLGQTVRHVTLNPRAKVFRGEDTRAYAALVGARLDGSEAAAKQMLFRFSGALHLGVHLGMTGETCIGPVDTLPRPHDHLVLTLERVALVYTDPRMFGRLRLHQGPTLPSWWTEIPPPLTSDAFTRARLAAILERRSRAPLKAALLDQDAFPGIGNWMADEVLWRAALHPATPAGRLDTAQQAALYRELRWVCRQALATIGETLEDPPKTWLFPHRWREGGRCPKTGCLLRRAEIGGRTTCWSPERQGDTP